MIDPMLQADWEKRSHIRTAKEKFKKGNDSLIRKGLEVFCEVMVSAAETDDGE